MYKMSPLRERALRSLLNEHLKLAIRQSRQSIVLLPALLRARLVFNVVVHQEMGQDDLDLRIGEESPWTRPNPVAEVDVV